MHVTCDNTYTVMHTNDTNPAATQSQTAAQGGIKLPLITIAHGCTLCGKYSVHQIQRDKTSYISQHLGCTCTRIATTQVYGR